MVTVPLCTFAPSDTATSFSINDVVARLLRFVPFSPHIFKIRSYVWYI